MGRFLSADPIGFAGNDANFYRFVANAPTIHVDPFGLKVCFNDRGIHRWVQIGDSSYGFYGDFDQGNYTAFGVDTGIPAYLYGKEGKVISPDNPGKPTKSSCQAATPEQENALKEYIDRRFNVTEHGRSTVSERHPEIRNPNYNVLTYNCYDFAREVDQQLQQLKKTKSPQ
jgi:hypothetical protein